MMKRVRGLKYFLLFCLVFVEINSKRKASKQKKLPPRKKKWLNLCSFVEHGIT